MLSKLKQLIQFRIKTWYVATRGWEEKDIRVLICLEDSIWYWLVLEWAWGIVAHLCHWSDYIKLPKFVRAIKGHWDDDDPEYYATWEDWYGDSIHSMFHCNICDPFFQWVYKHKEYFPAAWPQWELTLAEVKEKFAHDPEVWEWVEKSLEEHKQYDAEKAAEEAAENKE
jgi:hypothetical protein